MGALQQDPSKKRGFQVGTDQASLTAQQQRLQSIIDKKGGNAPKATKRLQQVNNALGALGTTPGQNQPSTPTPFQNVTNNSNDYLNSVFGQLNNQGQFQPGNYQDMRQKASDTAMNEFNRQNQSRFQQEDAAFEQQMAAEGVDPSSEKYRNRKADMMMNRNSAIQGAQNNAFQMGQGEQAQAYGQAYNTWQAPLQSLQAASPYYGYQAQAEQNQLDRNQQTNMQNSGFNFQKELAALQHKYNMQLQAAAPRGGGGGGGLSFDQQMALQNNQIDKNFYNNMVLYGMQNGQQMPQGGYGQGAANGVAQGISAGITNGLLR